jgi:hypothetical protein
VKHEPDKRSDEVDWMRVGEIESGESRATAATKRIDLRGLTRSDELPRRVEDSDPNTRTGEPPVESRVEEVYMLSQGGQTWVTRNNSVAREDVDTGMGRSQKRSGLDAQVERERWCAMVHMRSTTADEEDCQCTSTNDEDFPGRFPTTPAQSLLVVYTTSDCHLR